VNKVAEVVRDCGAVIKSVACLQARSGCWPRLGRSGRRIGTGENTDDEKASIILDEVLAAAS